MSKRPLCQQCQQPLPRCYCDLLVSITSSIETTIVQHPNEANHPKGTARLLSHCVNASIVTNDQPKAEDVFIEGKQPLLLFPGDEHQPAVPATDITTDPSKLQLIILDGTWRKCRKLVYDTPWLQQLPRLALPHTERRYHIRKAEKEGQLSTLEACALALSELEANEEKYLPLLHCFEQYIARLAQFIPEEHRRHR